MAKLDGRHVLIMATNRFEESELFEPRQRLIEEGAEVTLASIDRAEIMGTVHDEPGRKISPDITLEEVEIGEYDALLLPGGVGNPDRLRTEAKAIEIIRGFVASGKPVAAICHGPWLLVEADVIRGKTVTSWPSIRTDLRNAGANVVDGAAVVDNNLITSRNPDDIPAFNDALVAALCE